MRFVSIIASLGLGLAGCAEHEGELDGECSDGADNDADGLYDCDDPDCEDSSECMDLGSPVDWWPMRDGSQFSFQEAHGLSVVMDVAADGSSWELGLQFSDGPKVAYVDASGSTTGDVHYLSEAEFRPVDGPKEVWIPEGSFALMGTDIGEDHWTYGSFEVRAAGSAMHEDLAVRQNEIEIVGGMLSTMWLYYWFDQEPRLGIQLAWGVGPVQAWFDDGKNIFLAE